MGIIRIIANLFFGKKSNTITTNRLDEINAISLQAERNHTSENANTLKYHMPQEANESQENDQTSEQYGDSTEHAVVKIADENQEGYLINQYETDNNNAFKASLIKSDALPPSIDHSAQVAILADSNESTLRDQQSKAHFDNILRVKTEQKRKIEKEKQRQEEAARKKKEQDDREREERQRNGIIKELSDAEGKVKLTNRVLYHEIFGQGTVKSYDENGRYFNVFFDSINQEKPFVYPDALGKYLFLTSTTRMQERAQRLTQEQQSADDEQERAYCKQVLNYARARQKKAKDEQSLLSYGYNDYTDSYLSGISSLMSSAIVERSMWDEVCEQPYFARVVHDDFQSFYIGKHAVDEMVVDWRDKICNLYYQHQILIGNSKSVIRLVRNIEIECGVYLGFEDIFNEMNNHDDSNSLFGNSDKYLSAILQKKRKSNALHDIVQTIQKNQYSIITQPYDRNLYVSGCAGSGKTMILLHRLSYLVFNNPNIDISNTYVLSPTQLLNLVCDELSHMLHVDAAKRFTILSFYSHTIKEYYRSHNTHLNYAFDNVASNRSLSTEFLTKVYNTHLIHSFKERIKEILFLPEVRRQLVDSEKAALFSIYTKFNPNETNDHDLDDVMKNGCIIDDIYNEIEKKVMSLPRLNVYEKIRKLNHEIEGNLLDKSLPKKKLLLERIYSSWDLSDDPIYSDSNEIVVADSLFTEVYGCFNALSQRNAGNKNYAERLSFPSANTSDFYELVNDYRLFKDKYKRLYSFANNSSMDYFSEIVQSLINDLKRILHIDLSCTYEFELFYHLLSCVTLYKGFDTNERLIFIDELQDLSIDEVKVIEAAFPNAFYNVFGDIKQSINEKGMREADLAHFSCNKWTHFAINENYRNAHQITEFLNTRFCATMLPIGVQGTVIEASFDKLPNHMNIGEDDRCALIAKDIVPTVQFIEKHFSSLKERFSYITGDDCKIKKAFL